MRALLLVFLLTSCSTSVTTPLGFEFTGYIKKEGIGVVVEPPFWNWIVKAWEQLVD
jgi:hypothetical protein